MEHKTITIITVYRKNASKHPDRLYEKEIVEQYYYHNKDCFNSSIASDYFSLMEKYLVIDKKETFILSIETLRTIGD